MKNKYTRHASSTRIIRLLWSLMQVQPSLSLTHTYELYIYTTFFFFFVSRLFVNGLTPVSKRIMGKKLPNSYNKIMDKL